MTKAGLQFLGPRPRAYLWESLIASGINIKGVVDPTLKDNEGMGLMLDAARRSPGHIHIARVFPYDEEVGAACKAGADPMATARKWVARIAALASGDPAMRSLWYETGPNEPGVEYYEWINAYIVYVIALSLTEGLRLVWGNFNVGTPDYPLWDKLHNARRETILDNGHTPFRVLLGLHEYGTIAPMPDPRSAHHVLRYYQPSIRPLLAGIPKVLTELGDDPGYRGDNAEAYLEHFRWYDRQIAGDDNVLAWYGYCLPNQQNDWDHFALDNNTGIAIIEDARRAGGSQRLPAASTPAPVPSPAPEPPSDEYPYGAVVQTGGNNLMLRAGQSTKSTILAKMPSGSEVEVLYKEGAWYRVRYAIEGWAHSDFIKRRD